MRRALKNRKNSLSIRGESIPWKEKMSEDISEGHRRLQSLIWAHTLIRELWGEKTTDFMVPGFRELQNQAEDFIFHKTENK